MNEPLKSVLIIDDHEVVCHGIKMLLTGHLGEAVTIGMALDGLAAVALAEKSQPQLIILDLAMPKMAGFDVAIEIRKCSPNSKILILTAHCNKKVIEEVLTADVQGIVLKEEGNKHLLQGIDTVMQGKQFYSDKLKPLIADHQFASGEVSGGKKRNVSLSLRERQILKLVSEGYPSKEIARMLKLSPRTVDNHRRILMLKLDVRNALELAAYAHTTGIARCDPNLKEDLSMI
jgi:DNA-binding NarL/FixJ family response regulator